MIRLGGFLCKILGPLLKDGLPVIGNVLRPLGKRVLVPWGLGALRYPQQQIQLLKIKFLDLEQQHWYFKYKIKWYRGNS